MGLLLFIVVAIGAITYAVITGLHSRAKASTELAHQTQDTAVPTVTVVHPTGSKAAEQLVLPGNLQAYQDTPIWARSSGYLRHWYVDIGGHVKKGTLLADIEAPEVGRQLGQARADLESARANLGLAESTAKRYQFLLQTDSVSRQETDEKVSALAANKAAVAAMEQNVRRIEEIESFQKVYAPFDGVITARNTDVGALIDAGANTTGKELFHEAAIGTLRVYVNVPEENSRVAKPGVFADLTLDEFPGRSFRGKLVRTADAIDMTSRTLLVEIDVPNSRGELLPGSYASVHFKLPAGAKALTIPSNALLFRAEGLRVALVREGKTKLVPIKLGRDYGDEVEILSGVNADDNVIVNPSDAIASGQQVRIAASNQKNSGTAQ